MTLTPIRGTIINLGDVFVSTEDGIRYVTDRFSLWRLDELAGRSKLADALAAVQDGCYTLTAGGAVRPNKMFTSVPQVARLIPEGQGDALERLPFLFTDYKKDGAQLWQAPDGALVMFDARFQVGSDCILRRHESGNGEKPLSVFTRRSNELVGIIMPNRMSSTTLRESAQRLLAAFETPAQSVA